MYSRRPAWLILACFGVVAKPCPAESSQSQCGWKMELANKRYAGGNFSGASSLEACKAECCRLSDRGCVGMSYAPRQPLGRPWGCRLFYLQPPVARYAEHWRSGSINSVQGAKHVSIALVLSVVVVSAFALYCAAGIAHKRFHRGGQSPAAAGLLPNHSFWLNLWELCSDGMRLALHGGQRSAARRPTVAGIIDESRGASAGDLESPLARSGRAQACRGAPSKLHEAAQLGSASKLRKLQAVDPGAWATALNRSILRSTLTEMRSILTGIYLCTACSYHETAQQRRSAPQHRLSRGVRGGTRGLRAAAVGERR
jgi:hypothetical protein